MVRSAFAVTFVAIAISAGSLAFRLPPAHSNEMTERDQSDYELAVREYLDYLQERDVYDNIEEYDARDFDDFENFDARDEELLEYLRENTQARANAVSSVQAVTSTTTHHPKPTSCTDAELKVRRQAKKAERKRKQEEKKAKKAEKHGATTSSPSASAAITPTPTSASGSASTDTPSAKGTITSPPAATAVQTSATTTTGKNGIATVHVTTTAAVPECTADSFFKKLFHHHHKRSATYDAIHQLIERDLEFDQLD